MNKQNRRAILIIVDSLPADLFADLLSKNELPNINKFLINRGTYITHCTTSFPSVSFSTHATILTGSVCKNHGIPGVRWFSRKEKLNRTYTGPTWRYLNQDLMIDVRTIFDRLEEKSSCIWEPVSRGANNFIRMPRLLGRSCVTRAIQEINNDSKFICLWFPSMDMIGHIFGSDSKVLRFVMKRIDRNLGKLFLKLERDKLFEETLVVLSSDHGQRKTSNHFDLISHLKDSGFQVSGRLYDRLSPQSFYDRDIVVCTEGNGSAHIYLKNSLQKREVIESLFDKPGVRQIFKKDHDVIRVYDRNRNESEIRFRNSEKPLSEWQLSYLVHGKKDPLGIYPDFLSNRKMGKDKFYSANEWLSLTFSSPSPDIPVQICQLLLSKRAGDIVVSSDTGWDLRTWWHRGTHGGSLPQEMTVPLVISGPDQNSSTKKYARTIDIVPTILKFLGYEQPAEIDGNPIDI